MGIAWNSLQIKPWDTFCWKFQRRIILRFILILNVLSNLKFQFFNFEQLCTQIFSTIVISVGSSIEHARSYALAHARTCGYIHRSTRIGRHPHKFARTHTCMHTPLHPHAVTLEHTYARMHSHSRTLTPAHTRTRMYSQLFALSRTHTLLHSHALACIYTRTLAWAVTRTN